MQIPIFETYSITCIEIFVCIYMCECMLIRIFETYSLTCIDIFLCTYLCLYECVYIYNYLKHIL